MGVIASFGTVLSAGYSIYLYNRVCFGLPSKFLCYSRDLNRREFYILFTLVTLIYFNGNIPLFGNRCYKEFGNITRMTFR